MLQDVNLSSDAHNQALESLKAQLGHTQTQLQQEREITAALKVEFAERESRLQFEGQQLSDTLTAQQRQLTLQQGWKFNVIVFHNNIITVVSVRSKGGLGDLFSPSFYK